MSAATPASRPFARVAFHSDHATVGRTGGRLHVRIVREHADGRPARREQVYFGVPAGFHAHNDLVATALMTLVGRTCRQVVFNFPVSARCAGQLADLYHLDEIGPVDAGLEPRQPGRYLGLNFSGGVDSTAVWTLLRALLGDGFRTITSQYWDDDHREVAAARRFGVDVICATNLRAKGFDQAGRFNNAAPLLFADYLDLWGICTGHGYIHYPFSHESLRDGQEPYFLRSSMSFSAGGLEEVHLIRSVSEPGVTQLLVELAPELVEGALRGSARPGTDKWATRVLTFRRIYESTGKPLPDYLREIPDVEPRYRAGQRILYFRSLWFARWFGVAVAARLNPFIGDIDPATYAHLDFRWAYRYHPDMLPLIPADLRPRLLALFHRAGVYPFDERDYRDLEDTRTFLEAHGTPAITRVD